MPLYLYCTIPKPDLSNRPKCGNLNLMSLVWTIIFGYASIIEWQHMREGLKDRDRLRIVGPTIAAIALGFMASEALAGEWP